jgi:outer membrane protein TolC
MKCIAFLGLLMGLPMFHIQDCRAKEVYPNGEVIYWESEQQELASLLNIIKDTDEFIDLPKIIPLVSPGKQISISDEDSIHIALINSANIKSAVFQYQEQIAKLRTAYSAYYPSLSLYNTSYSWSESYETLEYGEAFQEQTTTNQFGIPTIEKIPASVIDSQNISYSNTNTFTAGLQLSFNIFDPKRDLNIAEEMEMKKYYYNMIIEEVKNEYKTINDNILKVKINDKFVELYSKAADYAKTAFKRIVESYLGGFSTDIDVNNYKAQYLAYEAKEATYMGKKGEAISNLLKSMGWPQDTNIGLVDDLTISSKWPINKNESITMAIKNSEKIRNLAIQSQKSYIQSQNALYGYIPVVSLNLTGSASKARGEVTKDWPYTSGEYNTSASVSVGVQWSLFDGFSNFNTATSYKKAGQSYNQQKQNEILTIESKVSTEITSQAAELEAYRLNQKAFQARKDLTELTNLGFMSGYNTVFDLIKAQQDTVESMEATINNAERINQSYIDLQQLTGYVSCNQKQAISYCEILNALAPYSFKQIDSAN